MCTRFVVRYPDRVGFDYATGFVNHSKRELTNVYLVLTQRPRGGVGDATCFIKLIVHCTHITYYYYHQNCDDWASRMIYDGRITGDGEQRGSGGDRVTTTAVVATQLLLRCDSLVDKR